jgi:6-phosphogluconolactonase
MKRCSLHVFSFALLLAGIGCGGGSAPKSVTLPVEPACTSSSTPYFAYVLGGDVTAWGNGTISAYSVDSCSGALTALSPATVATGSDPEDMVVDPLGRFVYAANLVSNASDLATISMYTINPTTGALTPTTPPTVPTGFFPQGIAIDPEGRFVYTANSDDNTVSMFTINQTTGVLTPTSPPSVPAGWSPISVTVDPTGRFVYAVNQDDGTISMYTINVTSGVLTPTTPPTVPGGSPFDITVTPSGKFVYVPNAYSNNMVLGFTIDSSTGVLMPTAQVGVQAGNSPTSVAIDPSDKFAYVVNRIGDTVSAYGIDSTTGSLSPIAVATTGPQPWRITVDLSGKFVYVGDEADSSISIFSINADGSLTFAGMVATGQGPTFAIGLAMPHP